MTITNNATSGASATSGSTSSLGSTTTAQEQSDRFLKLLVAQMSNQDPLNPMDSAQVTSQMAQISTVQGVSQLNETVSGLNTQFTQLQTMQGAALVGKDVLTEGNAVRVDAGTQKGSGGYEISTDATSVKVELLDANGTVVASDPQSNVTAGRHTFDLPIPSSAQGKPLTFKVTAVNGTTPVDTLSLATHSISAVSTLNGAMAVELNDGSRVTYDAIWAFL